MAPYMPFAAVTADIWHYFLYSASIHMQRFPATL